MQAEKTQIREKLLEWEAVLSGYKLPTWEDFPSLPLYMDQVIYLINGYLQLAENQAGEERLVTPAMINNYVKLKIIPPPVKKRYGRLHLAYLLMVCMLKQCMSTGDIKKLLPVNQKEEAMRETYAAFVRTAGEVKEQFCQAMHAAAKPILAQEGPPAEWLIFQTAAAANLFRLATREMVSLSGEGEKIKPEHGSL